MNKWLARLQTLESPETAEGSTTANCQNCQKGLVSALSGEETTEPPEEVSPGPRGGRRILDGRRDRLLRWGWSWSEATAMAERLALRDAEFDGRVTCVGDCSHYRPGRCGNHQRAGLNVSDLGRDQAELLQWCPGVLRLPSLFVPVDGSTDAIGPGSKT